MHYPWDIITLCNLDFTNKPACWIQVNQIKCDYPNQNAICNGTVTDKAETLEVKMNMISDNPIILQKKQEEVLKSLVSV